MGLLDVWDYIRTSGDRRLRAQGYLSSGVGLLERYRRSSGFWEPHLARNRIAMLEAAGLLKERGGTLLILGAGRLLDVPWQELFPKFNRVVLSDADAAMVPYVERLVSTHRGEKIAPPVFEIGDCSNSLVDLAAWAEHTIQRASSVSQGVKSLSDGFQRAGAEQAPWARTYADLRMVVSTNLLSQLGYFPRTYIQNEFKKRFNEPFTKQNEAAEALERYFDRVRIRHVLDIASQRSATAYVSGDIAVRVYALKNKSEAAQFTKAAPKDAGVELDERGEPRFVWPVEIVENSDPLHGQKIRDLWPEGSTLLLPKKWVWHIVPQGTEKKYQDTGRVHIVEAWTKKPN
jgi:hypothetical protein